MAPKLTSFDSFLCAQDEVHDLDVERVDNNTLLFSCKKCRFQHVMSTAYLEEQCNGK